MDEVQEIQEVIKKQPFKPSPEQQEIINAIKNNKNIICNSVAGSGKTTTILNVAYELPDKNILQITYNKMLKDEVESKKNYYGLINLVIKTFHSMANNYYNKNIMDDVGIEKLIKLNLPLISQEKFDIIIIDEAQDQTPLLNKFLHKYIKDMANHPAGGKNPLLVIIGDENQAVYEFKSADRRFLTLADKLWFNNKEVVFLRLSQSFRVNINVAAFVNEVMLGEGRIISCKSGAPVDYLMASSYNAINWVYLILEELLMGDIVSAGDIFILTPSIKSQNEKIPYKQLENILVRRGFPCYVPISDDQNIRSEVAQNKIVFSTIHQSKGRERKVVVLLGFDNSYYKYYARGEDKSKCPATLYVAATRALERLIIVDSACDKHGQLEFVKKNHKELHSLKYINIIGSASKIPAESSQLISEYHDIAITNLVKFIKGNYHGQINELIDSIMWRQFADYNPVDIPGVVDGEEVSDINGIVMPMIFQQLSSGQNCYYDKVIKDSRYCNLSKPITIADFINMAIKYQTVCTGLLFKEAQIKKFDWLTTYQINICLANMGRINRECCNYETGFLFKENEVRLNGVCDIIDDNVLWEIKCVDVLTIEHKLQLICYAFLYMKNYKIRREFKLLNIRTGETFVICGNKEKEIEQIIKLLINNKTEIDEKISDDEFIRRHKYY